MYPSAVGRPGGAHHVGMHVNGDGASIDRADWNGRVAGLSPTESVYNLVPSHVLEDVDIPFLLKDAPMSLIQPPQGFINLCGLNSDVPPGL